MLAGPCASSGIGLAHSCGAASAGALDWSMHTSAAAAHTAAPHSSPGAASRSALPPGGWAWWPFRKGQAPADGSCCADRAQNSSSNDSQQQLQQQQRAHQRRSCAPGVLLLASLTASQSPQPAGGAAAAAAATGAAVSSSSGVIGRPRGRLPQVSIHRPPGPPAFHEEQELCEELLAYHTAKHGVSRRRRSSSRAGAT